MKNILSQTTNFTAVDKFNIKMATSLKDASGKTLVVTKACYGEDVDQDGQVVMAGALITTEGAFATISGTAVELIQSLIEMFEENNNEPINVTVNMKKGNAGREYIALSIAE